jgi:hypothetical protein
MGREVSEMNNEPVAIRYDFDGYGYQYMDSGSGSDWQTRVDGELLYTHPVKELHLSLQKSKQTGELLAVTYTDDEHRIVEVLWSNESHKIATIAVKSNELGV